MTSAGEDSRCLKCVHDYRVELPVIIKEGLGQILLGTMLAKLHQPKSVNKNLVLGLLACYIQQKKMQTMRHHEHSQNGERGKVSCWD